MQSLQNVCRREYVCIHVYASVWAKTNSWTIFACREDSGKSLQLLWLGVFMSKFHHLVMKHNKILQLTLAKQGKNDLYYISEDISTCFR